MIGTAEQYIGVPYKYGGTSPRSGFDCSGFVQYVFARQGVNLPRTASQQAQVGTPIAPDWRAVSAGDLVMFEENGRIGHVAIYAGRNRIIHSTLERRRRSLRRSLDANAATGSSTTWSPRAA